MREKEGHIFLTAREFFSGAVDEAVEERNVRSFPLAKLYLVNLLEHFLPTENLFSSDSARETMAERLLKSAQADPQAKREMLKRLGDTTLYVSGFFGDSLKRKIVDLDYYVEIGSIAYQSLASIVDEDTSSRVFGEFGRRFPEYVDILSHISQKVSLQTNEDLLRLYERYILTGSELARDQLLERGIIASDAAKKSSKQ